MIPLAKVTKLDVSIDLSQPVLEIVDIISIVINTHPGRQQELLEQIDLKIGEALANLQKEKSKKEEAPVKESPDKSEE